MKRYVEFKNGTVQQVVFCAEKPTSSNFIKHDSAETGDVVINGVFTKPQPTLEELIADVKEQAAQQIEAIAWKIERAQEREALGLDSDLLDVYQEREDIRQWSNEEEIRITEEYNATEEADETTV